MLVQCPEQAVRLEDNSKMIETALQNTLDAFACGLHANFSLISSFFFQKQKMFDSLNVIKEMVNMQGATIEL